MAHFISSRTPEGRPHACPVCHTHIVIEPSTPPGDAPCPSCGVLLWFAPTAEGMRVFDVASIKNLRERVLTIVGDNLGLNIDQLLHSPAFLEDMWADSLDLAELIMDLEQEFDLTIAAEEAFGLRTLGDVIDYLESRLC